MLRLAADENLDGAIVRGALRRNPDLDVVRMVEQGQLLLSDPIVRYIPEFELFEKGRVTVWHLLTHTSGLDEWHPTAYRS